MQWWGMLGISTACKFPTIIHSKGFLGFMNETNQMTEINQTTRLSAIYWHNIVGSSVSCFEQKSRKIADSPIFALSGSCGISRFRPRSVELSARNERGFAEKCGGLDLKRLRHGDSSSAGRRFDPYTAHQMFQRLTCLTQGIKV
jgi:hypothetical protein